MTAADWTHDPGAGFDIDRFTDELAASRDRRIKYVIANGLILDSRAGFHPWTWRKYTGANPHRRHVHLSVMPAFCDDTSVWHIPMLGAGSPGPGPGPSAGRFPLPHGHYFGLASGPERSHGGFFAWERPHVRRIQQALQRKGYAPRHAGWADGLFERPTKDAVAAWQRREVPGTTRFGEVWFDDWARLFG